MGAGRRPGQAGRDDGWFSGGRPAGAVGSLRVHPSPGLFKTPHPWDSLDRDPRAPAATVRWAAGRDAMRAPPAVVLTGWFLRDMTAVEQTREAGGERQSPGCHGPKWETATTSARMAVRIPNPRNALVQSTSIIAPHRSFPASRHNAQHPGWTTDHGQRSNCNSWRQALAWPARLEIDGSSNPPHWA
ncbi:hypothetical protein ACCO45_000207 [Purpureocillium lilacinum]|uniref:Uncharacterized protein n=1 Tax=Purpureocillium lilacinum TaxID=33203 RepID=A0ACC4E6S2_PURLI